MRSLRSILVVGVLLFGGCAKKADPDAWAGPDKVPEEFIGKLSKTEVRAIEKKLKETRFPAPEGTIASLMPPGSRSIPQGLQIEGWGPPDEKGRQGGWRHLYWLNEEQVLMFSRVTFTRGDDFEIKEVWADVMTWRQSASYTRSPYDY